MDCSDIISLNLVQEETSRNICLKQSNFNTFHPKYFNILNCEFLSSDHQIVQSYNKKNDIIIKLLKKSAQVENVETKHENFQEDKKLIEKAKDVLINQETKEDYLHFLFVNYILSQPISLEKLKNNFQFYIFPFYLFSIEGDKSLKANYLVIDYIKKTLSFYYKDKLEKAILGQIIKYIKRENKNLLVISRGGEKLIFSAEVQQQRDLIYVLLLYLIKISKVSDTKQKIEEHNLNLTYESIKLDDGSELENENYDYDHYLSVDLNNFKINYLKILKDEKYLPSGIILKSHIEKSTKRSLTALPRFMVLGNANIIIFK
jgi:hypothetical protein